MKKQITLTVIIGVILAIFIYKLTYHDEMYLLSLGDSLSLGMTSYNVEGYSYNDYLRDYFEENSILREYIKEYSSPDESPTSLLNKIKNNESLPTTNTTIQHELSKAKIITLSIGMEYFHNKKILKTKDINNYINNMATLLEQIRIFNKNQLFLISLYPTNKLKKETITTINNELKNLSTKYQCQFIDISNINEFSQFFFNPQTFYLNYKGHQYISELIIDKLN